jgi:hypothetical protein
MPARSTSAEGAATRSFIMGSKLCPPANTLEFLDLCRNFVASATDFGLKYSKVPGIIAGFLLIHAPLLAEAAPN